MKIAAAECLIQEGRYDEAGGFYSESSDHFHRDKKGRESNRALGVAIAGYLAARNFNTAINIMRKAEKRLKGKGVAIKLIPVPRQLSSDCGVCLRFRTEDESEIRRALEEGQIDIQGIYPI